MVFWLFWISMKKNPRFLPIYSFRHKLLNALIDFKAQKSGEYILRVSDFLTRGGDDYWYRVRIRKAAQIDFVFPSESK